MAEIKRDAAQAQPPRPQSGARRPPAPPLKKKKGVSLGLIFSLLLLLVATGAVCAVYFDVFGFKDMAVSAFKLDSPSGAQLAELSDIQKTLDERNSQLDAREAELTRLERELRNKESDIVKRQEELDLAAQQLETERQERENMAAMAAVMEVMDSAGAARAIGGLGNPADMARVLLNMDGGKAALIMDAMDEALVTQVLEQMLLITR